jgi:hypothetical protein
MARTLERAMEELARLPEADQQQIGLRRLSHVEKLRQLRADTDHGLHSRDAGEGQPFDIEEFKRSNAPWLMRGGRSSDRLMRALIFSIFGATTRGWPAVGCRQYRPRHRCGVPKARRSSLGRPRSRRSATL